MRRHRTRALGGCVLAVAIGAASTGCASGRSAQAFCTTYQTEKQSFTTKYQPQSQAADQRGGLAALASLAAGLQSLGDVAIILDKLERVAPDEIDPDMVVVRDSWKQMTDNLGTEAGSIAHPSAILTTLFQSLLMSMETQGSWDRVGTYITQHCGGG